MEKTLICPNIEICAIYIFNYEPAGDNYGNKNNAKIDCINYDKKKKEYFCEELKLFNKKITPQKSGKVKSYPTGCALIKILNNTEAPVILKGKR